MLFFGCSLSAKNVRLFSALRPFWITLFIRIYFVGLEDASGIYIQDGVRMDVLVTSPSLAFSNGCFLSILSGVTVIHPWFLEIICTIPSAV